MEHDFKNPYSMTFAGIPDNYAAYENSRFVLIPAGYDRTTSYGSGARRGPQAILDASRHMELFDEETKTNTYEEGIFLCSEIESSAEGPDKFIERVEHISRQVLDDSKIPIVLGGEHTVSLGNIRACKERSEKLTVVQIDAHADLRDQFGGSAYSHACVMRRAVDLGCHLVQVGIRSMSDEEFNWVESNDDICRMYYARDVKSNLNVNWVQDIVSPIDTPVYLTIDLDGLDPSIMPSTGTPEPGGLSWYEVLELLRELCRLTNIIGFDVVELAPIASIHAPDFLVARLLYRLMGYISLKEKIG